MRRVNLEYLIWQSNPVGGFCTLEYLKNVDDPHELKRGISRTDGFPSEACFQMDASYPKEIKLADNIYNLDRMIVVSNRLKDFVEAKEPESTEFLSIEIFNHKGRMASEDHFIINPFAVIDCIDKDKSKLKWNKIDPDLIAGCYRLVLIKENIDNAPLLFRPKHLPTIVMIRDDLAEEITREDFTGIRFKETDEFQL